MTNLWTMGEIAHVTKGRATGDGAIARVTIDSRSVQPGDLFVAIHGDRFDGHDFVRDALEKGATAALVSRMPEALPDRAPVILVEDTMVALYAIARAARARTHAKIIGVTGSVGKTSAKEALRLTLSASGKTFATTGNLNNHIGLPLTLANLPADADYGVFEIGMNHANEIAPLSKLLQPDIALITTVEAVHLEFFPNVEAIADAKAEIFEGMAEGSIAVLPMDNPHFARLEKAALAKDLSLVRFGKHAEAEYRVMSSKLNEQGTEILAHLKNTPVTLQMAAYGHHWAGVAAAVLAVAEAAEADLAKTAQALSQFREPVGRGQLSLVKLTHGDVTLIDDSYNASPASMRAAFEKLRAVKETGTRVGRTVAVLGDMLELGESADELHIGLVPCLVNNQIDLVFTAGTMMERMFRTLPEAMQGYAAANAAELGPQLLEALRPRDLVLVKGSHGSHMHRVAQMIRDAGTQQEETADAL